jgi:nitrogen regulatory protein PII
VENPRPVLRQLEAKDALPPGAVPRIALPGAGLGLVWPIGNRGFTLTARGAGFVEDSVVRWGGKRLATTFVSPTELRAEVENDEVERLGAVAVTVTSPSPGGGESVALAVVVVENPRPVLGRLDGDGVVALPTLAPPPLYRRPAGSGGFTLILIGSGLVRDTTARWNGRALSTKFISATQVEARVEEEDAERVGPATVTLTSPQPGGGASNPLTLTIVEPQPAITRLEGSGFVPPPAGAPAGTLARPAANRGFTLTVRGRGFIEDSVVQWGERRLRPKLIDDATLEVRIDDDDAEQVGSYAVTVVNPKPGGGASNAITVLVTENPRPTITGLSVTTARAGSGDLTITVRGRDFTERSSTRWNGQGRRTTTSAPASCGSSSRPPTSPAPAPSA